EDLSRVATKRPSDFAKRRDIQQEKLHLPLLPTTTIGSMKKSVAAMKLAGSLHIAETYENHLQKILEG
ncbi:hypothetical protein LGW14_06205, partial [Streptococcus mutans]|nr:hypothetical protein [Streptococcus mutans]